MLETYNGFDTLKEAISAHELWVETQLTDAPRGVQLDLSGTYFSEADFSKANLYHANFSGADLEKANFSDAILVGANFSGARLYHANLSDADVRDANLNDANCVGSWIVDADMRNVKVCGAKFSHATLSGTDLRGVNLSGVVLYKAKLRHTRLEGTKLSGANLEGVDFGQTNLRGANLHEATFGPYDLSAYLSIVVPSLCAMGGAKLEDVAMMWSYKAKREEKYANFHHTWSYTYNPWEESPMSVAFDVQSIEDVPKIFRREVDFFVQMYNAGAIPPLRKNDDGSWTCETTEA